MHSNGSDTPSGNAGERLDRIERILQNTASLAQGNAEAITRLAQTTRESIRETNHTIQSVAQLTLENAAAIRELRAAQAEMRAGQDENRAILNQILRRDQERGG